MATPKTLRYGEERQDPEDMFIGVSFTDLEGVEQKRDIKLRTALKIYYLASDEEIDTYFQEIRDGKWD